jgi:hypothetical protein
MHGLRVTRPPVAVTTEAQAIAVIRPPKRTSERSGGLRPTMMSTLPTL